MILKLNSMPRMSTMFSTPLSEIYQNILDHLSQRVQMPKTAPGLEKTLQALQRLTLCWPKDLRHNILVGGTNGKGSVCRLLEHFFLAHGHRTFLYTSPHLVDIRERIRWNGKPISISDFTLAFKEVDSLTQDLNLSHFETLTVMAAWLAYRQPIENKNTWFIWEVGLGGTWDSTNAIPHGISVLTQLGLDHQDILGPTLSEIAQNKLGILQKNNTVIVHPCWTDNLFSPLLKEKVQLLNLNLHESSTNHLGTIPFRFYDNLCVAQTVLKALHISAEPGMASLDQYYWPGRGDWLNPPQIPCPILLSGDHNPQGIKNLLHHLNQYSYKKLHFLVGIGKGKDANQMMKQLTSVSYDQMVLTQTPFQGRSEEEWRPWTLNGFTFMSEPLDAFFYLTKNAHPQDMIVVTGSLYLVGEIYKHALKNNWLPETKKTFFRSQIHKIYYQ